MGALMKEALEYLCRGDNAASWCYAVFWKINCRIPMLLIWEEGHYELARYSGLSSVYALENPELFLKEREAVWNRSENSSCWIKAQTEDRIGTIYKQMIRQVHVGGQGIVGCVASTGKHRWVFRETYIGERYSARPADCIADSQHPAGCQQQFSAGIQTIAVIPVLPDGVVQLGSTQPIMENLEFVNHVQMLIMKLKSVPVSFIPESTQKALGQKIQVHGSLGMTALTIPSRNPCVEMGTPLPFGGNSLKRHTLLKAPASRFLKQPSSAVNIPIYENMQTNASAVSFTSNSASTTTAKAYRDIFQQNDLPLKKHNVPLRTQLKNGSSEAQVIISNQKLPQYNPSSGRSPQLSVVSSGAPTSNKTLMEQQIPSCVEFQGPLNKYKTLLRPCGNTVVSSLDDHNIASLLGGNCNVTACGTWRSVELYPSCPSTEGGRLQYANLPTVAVLPVSNHLNNSNNVPAIFGKSWPSLSSTTSKHSGTERVSRQGQIENDLSQAPDFQLTGSVGDEHFSWPRVIPGFVQDCLESCLNPPKGSQGSVSSSCVKNNPLDALDPDFKIDPHYFNWDSLMGSSTCISELDLIPGFDDTESEYFSESKPDHLLDAVVSKFCSSSNQNSDDNLSCKTTLTTTAILSVDAGSNSYRPLAAPEQKQGELFVLSQALANAEIKGSDCFKSTDKTKEGSQTDGASKSQISLWVEDGQSINHDSSSISHSKKADEAGKSNRKRPRRGESSRPRPKDRQMIQDRVKELREIVPNGAKCSIDALLERTIKHMLFLQSVTKHADQLKQTSESKLISKDGGLMLKDNFEGGATWAFQVDSQSTVCPIIVEDLAHPRQMLVEMVCEERGLFLEIADVIRGLGLTILKGVMEARNDKVWARFVVEANREVTRMDIFPALMRLLEQTSKGSLAPNVIGDSRNTAIQNTYRQAIP